MGKGRRRKSGPREPSGRLQRSRAEGITVTAWQRIRTAGAKVGSDPKLVTHLGRMAATGELTDIEVTAGFKIAEVYGRFERSIGRRRTAASPSYEVGRGWDAGGEEDVIAVTRSKAAGRAFSAMQDEMRRFQAQVRAATEELCVDDLACPSWCWEQVRALLRAIAAHFGLTSQSRDRRIAPVAPSGGKQAPQRSGFADLERLIFVEAVGSIAPDVDEAQIEEIFYRIKTMTDREKFRLDKAGKPPRAGSGSV